MDRLVGLPSPPVQRYFPLRVGYGWTYVERVVTATQREVLQRQVTLTIESRHQQEFSAHWDFQSGHVSLPNVRYRLVEDGIQEAHLTGDTAYTAFDYLLKAPLVVDATWRTGQGQRRRITAVGMVCSVPAGRFDVCLELLTEAEPTPDSRVQTRQRFALDIGLVWQEQRLFSHAALTRIDTMVLQKRPQPLQF